jgi:hypothetical protein
MPEVAGLTKDITEGAKEVGMKIGNFLKRQYRLRLTNACHVCNNLNLRAHDETHPIGWLDLDYIDIRSAAQAGCPHCTLMRTCVQQPSPWVARQLKQNNTVNFKVMLQYHENSFELTLGYDKGLKFEIFLPSGKFVCIFLTKVFNRHFLLSIARCLTRKKLPDCLIVILTSIQGYIYHHGHSYGAQA